jgi:hypothetical protein
MPLFCYPHGSPATLRLLTTCVFLNCVNAILVPPGYLHITGHCFCIGGTTDLLVHGVPPAIVRMAGHWHSNSFLLYWRKHNTVILQHVQNIAELPGHITHHAQPRVG